MEDIFGKTSLKGKKIVITFKPIYKLVLLVNYNGFVSSMC